MGAAFISDAWLNSCTVEATVVALDAATGSLRSCEAEATWEVLVGVAEDPRVGFKYLNNVSEERKKYDSRSKTRKHK